MIVVCGSYTPYEWHREVSRTFSLCAGASSQTCNPTHADSSELRSRVCVVEASSSLVRVRIALCGFKGTSLLFVSKSARMRSDCPLYSEDPRAGAIRRYQITGDGDDGQAYRLREYRCDLAIPATQPHCWSPPSILLRYLDVSIRAGGDRYTHLAVG